MASIHLLAPSVAELIAAGEVIERPASIAKELTENAIDAGAKHISVEIKDGGISLLRVSDDGCGIAREDVPKAFLRHATSKIGSAEDLDAIYTLGFRGEALASITAVTRTEMITRTAQEEYGTKIVLNGSEVLDLSEAGCATGTVVTVRDLFFNTPARMKFLKRNVSEAGAVGGYLEKLAVSHPDISFRFIREDKQVFQTSGDGDWYACIYAVYGKALAQSLLKVDYAEGGMSVSGFISRPQSSRANRAMQMFYINGRLIRSKTCMAALEEAYKHSVMQGKYPCCVLRLQLSPEYTDVNVHPQKLEVRFADERPVFHGVYHAVRQALADFTQPKEAVFADVQRKAAIAPDPSPVSHMPPAVARMTAKGEDTREEGWNRMLSQHRPVGEETGAKAIVERLRAGTLMQEEPERDTLRQEAAGFDVPQTPPGRIITCAEDLSVPSGAQRAQPFPTDPEAVPTFIDRLPATNDAPPQTVLPAASHAEAPIVRAVGEVLRTYIVAEFDGRLYFIDKHAAHERILFEQLRRREELCAQVLLLPVAVTLSAEEYQAVCENMDELSKLQFSLDEFGDNTLLVREIPSILSPGEAEQVVQEIAGNLLQHKYEKNFEKLDWVYHSVACRAATKAGDKSAPAVLQKLAQQVFTDESIRFCPHGRPVLIEITKKELEKQFGRAK